MDSPLGSPVASPLRRAKPRVSCRRLDKLCCLALGYFPLLFVYGTTSWAIYTQVYSISYHSLGGWRGTLSGGLAFFLYVMALWSYTFAVFTSPGSPLDNKHAYSHLPSHETSAVTVKSDGQDRFCKKCQCRKPDRAHHCSSCHTCVLKMDHHCPWLANCLGLYNYKAFLLFLIYTSLLCIVCFIVSSAVVYAELFNESSHFVVDDFTPVNWVLLAVVSGIIGLVLTGFTTWHLLLTSSNMTTIESLEKVRYTLPSLRRGAYPGDPQLSGRHYHEQRRYTNYMLEESSKKLPHAFNLGWRRNFAAVFGGRDKALMWGLPMFTGSGDGWNWETSAEWRSAVDEQKTERDRWLREQGERERAAGWGYDPAEEAGWEEQQQRRGGNGGLVQHATNGNGQRRMSKADKLLGRLPGSYSDSEGIPLRPVRRHVDDMLRDDLEEDEDENEDLDTDVLLGAETKTTPPPPPPRATVNAAASEWGNWGD